MKKLLFSILLSVPYFLSAQISTSSSTKPEIVASCKSTVITKTIIMNGTDTMYLVSFIGARYPYLSTRRSFYFNHYEDIKTMTNKLVEMHDHKDPTEQFNIQTKTDQIMLYWSKGSLFVGVMPKGEGQDDFFLVKKEWAEKLNQF